MSLARYQFTVVDDAGNALPAASVEVRREVAGAPLAVLYSDREGATPLGNPMAADADGFAAFHVVGGAYRVTASKGGFSRVWRFVGIGLASEQDTIAAGSPWVFDAATADADPGAGLFRLNNATPASATAIYFDNLNAFGADVSAWLDTFDDGGGSGNRGTVTLMAGDGSALLIARVTGSVVNGTGYRKVSVTPLVAAGLFAAGQTIYLQFVQSAAAGGVGGSTGAADNALLRSDGIGGATLQATGIIVDDSNNMAMAGGMITGAASVAATDIFCTGLHILDTNESHVLTLDAGSNLTGDRTLTITTGDGDIEIDLTDPGADRLLFWDDSASKWRDLTLGTGLSITDTTINASGSGAVLQMLSTDYTANANLSTTIPYDDTTPTSSEGTQVLSQAINLASISSRVKIDVTLNGCIADVGDRILAAVFRGTTCINAQAVAPYEADDNPITLSMSFIDSPAASGSVTYSVRAGPDGGSSAIRLNGTTAARIFGGVAKCTLVLTELAS